MFTPAPISEKREIGEDVETSKAVPHTGRSLNHAVLVVPAGAIDQHEKSAAALLALEAVLVPVLSTAQKVWNLTEKLSRRSQAEDSVCDGFATAPVAREQHSFAVTVGVSQ